MEKELSQDELFKRDGFTCTSTMPHPDSGKPMKFTQWEAKYVSSLEFRVYQLETYVKQLEHVISLRAKLDSDLRDIRKD